jgi:hypothetical protein
VDSEAKAIELFGDFHGKALWRDMERLKRPVSVWRVELKGGVGKPWKLERINPKQPKGANGMKLRQSKVPNVGGIWGVGWSKIPTVDSLQEWRNHDWRLRLIPLCPGWSARLVKMSGPLNRVRIIGSKGRTPNEALRLLFKQTARTCGELETLLFTPSPSK